METFEQRIADTVNKKMNDGTIEKLVEQYIEKGVSEALKNIFSYCGSGRELLESKLNEIMIPVIERHDFNQYLTKLDTVLTEIVNMTNLADNKTILENFKELMKEPEIKEIKLSEIFQKYCEYVAENVSTDDLEACCEDGEPYYEHVTANVEVEHEDKSWLTSSRFDDCKLIFTCEQDEDLNCQIKLYKDKCEDTWKILLNTDSIDINSLENLSSFEILINNLKRAFVKIELDIESDCDDDIEPEEKPEYTLE